MIKFRLKGLLPIGSCTKFYKELYKNGILQICNKLTEHSSWSVTSIISILDICGGTRIRLCVWWLITVHNFKDQTYILVIFYILFQYFSCLNHCFSRFQNKKNFLSNHKNDLFKINVIYLVFEKNKLIFSRQLDIL